MMLVVQNQYVFQSIILNYMQNIGSRDLHF